MTETMMADANQISDSAPASETVLGEATVDTTETQSMTDQQQSPGDQDQSAQADAETGESEGDGAEAKAPEAYDFKAPEGQEYDSEVINAFADVARELDLSQEDAQMVLDKVAPKMAERQQAQIDAIKGDWLEAAKTDKEFGGDNLEASVKTAKAALEQFGTPEFAKLLDESGLGNHPEMIRLMTRVGKAISEDNYVGADLGAKSGKTGPRDFNGLAAQLYGNQSGA